MLVGKRLHGTLWLMMFGFVGIVVHTLFAESPPQTLDRSSFARPSGSFSYRKIASSHHPAVLMGDWRCKIGPEAQLFVDDYLVHSAQGLKQTLHQPKKYAGNPIFKPERPWEKTPPPKGKKYKAITGANGTILKDPASGLWRMYYSAMFRRKCLAVSDDLLHWKRPVLNLVESEGSKENNIVFDDMICDTHSVIYDNKETDPAKRWKAVLYHYRHGNSRAEGLYAYYSPDGIHWTLVPKPIMNTWVHAPGMRDNQWAEAWPMPGVGDVVNFRFDEKLRKFVAYLKLATYRNGKFFRSRGMSESDDFIHWSEPRITILPDGEDPEDLHLYGNTGWPYESVWLGTLRAYYENAGNVNLQLICSRDGRHWKRAGNRQTFIPNGPVGSYDEGYHTEFSNPPIPVGDELWFFYGGTTTSGKNADRSQWVGTINLATLRRDGFVSLDAGAEEGWVVTRPLLFDGEQMFVNADAEGGDIRVEVLTFQFTKPPAPPLKAIEGYEKESCHPVTSDGPNVPICWKDHKNLSRLAGEHVRLRFYLKNAKLYSFTIK